MLLLYTLPIADAEYFCTLPPIEGACRPWISYGPEEIAWRWLVPILSSLFVSVFGSGQVFSIIKGRGENFLGSI
jgi:hypothetical protein